MKLNARASDIRSVGIDLGGTRVKIGIVEGSRLESTRIIPTRPERGPEDTLAEIIHNIREMSSGAIAAIGIGVPGLVADGSLVGGLNLPGWTDVPIKRVLERGLGQPVAVMMDIEAIAAGEFFSGGHPTHPRLFVFTLGTGVGTAAVLDGDLQAGAGGLMLLGGDEEAIPGGAFVTLEQSIAASAIVSRASLAMRAHPECLLGKLAAETALTAEMVCDAARAGDPVALEVWRQTGVALGWAAVNVAHLLLLDRVVIGGGVSQAGEILLSPTMEFFNRQLTPAMRGRCDLVISTLGDHAGVVGAARLAAANL